MQQAALGMALALAFAIMAIGALYISRPLTAARSFGLPPPGDADNVASWLRLKGVRDIATGLMVLATARWGQAEAVGVVLLAAAFIPAGDMLVVITGRGSVRSALAIHGVTTLVMVPTAIALILRLGAS